MLISKTVQVRWLGNTAPHYLEKGYEFTKWGEFFECVVEDLMPTSTIKVEVKCDYCEDGISQKPYRDYLKTRKEIAKDCCKNRSCMVLKTKEVSLLRYGVESPSQLEEKKQNAREKFQTPKESVLKISLEKGIKILNIEDYQNDRTRLKVICMHHEEYGEYETNFSNIKSSVHCCRNKKLVSSRRIDGKVVLEEFENAGLIPLFSEDDYKGNNHSLPYICKKHEEEGVQYKSRRSLQQSAKCRICINESRSKSHRTPYEDIETLMISKGMIPIDLYSYVNKDTKLEYKCVKHPNFIQETYIGTLDRVKVPCKYCREENSIAPLSKKMRTTSSTWRKEVEKECDFKCVFTGSNVYDVHHLYSYSSMIRDSLEYHGIRKKNSYTANEEVLVREYMLKAHSNVKGVCIHPELHTLFHTIYGKGQEDFSMAFSEFSEELKKGKYNSYLKDKNLKLSL